MNSEELYFIDTIEGAEIVLQTDACDYGIGGWIIKDGQRMGCYESNLYSLAHYEDQSDPGQRMRKACHIWDYLLRGERFIVETDC